MYVYIHIYTYNNLYDAFSKIKNRFAMKTSFFFCRASVQLNSFYVIAVQIDAFLKAGDELEYALLHAPSHQLL